MANTAGEGAYWLLVIYLLESYFFAALWAVTFWFIAYHVIRIFRWACEDSVALRKVAKFLNVGGLHHPPHAIADDCIVEIAALQKRIKELENALDD